MEYSVISGILINILLIGINVFLFLISIILGDVYKLLKRELENVKE